MPSELDELAALLRDHGTPLGLDTGQADEFDCCADAILAAGYRRHPVGITEDMVEAAARSIFDRLAERTTVGGAAWNSCLRTARAALEAAEAVRHA